MLMQLSVFSYVDFSSGRLEKLAYDATASRHKMKIYINWMIIKTRKYPA